MSQISKSKFHFVGVGGIGMCGLAELLYNMGAKVTGSDLAENTNTEHLKKIGIKIFKGHQAEQVSDVDVVVFSSAVQSSNPEIIEAKKRKIPLIPRAEALAEIMRFKRGIAVAGTHGKTTTTSMTAAIFLEAQIKPTIVVGGRLNLIQSTALLGEGEWLIAEADESDGSFHKLTPEIAIITNIDSDHLDYFKNFENLKHSFKVFAEKVPFYGSVIACGDDPIIQTVFENFNKTIFTYGFSDKNDYQIKGENGKYELFFESRRMGQFNLHVPGKHNALNATAAIITALKAGISFDVCQKGLERFQGVDRRFHFKGEKKNVLVYDDYGHHPTEVKAVLQGFREKFPDRKLVVFFQPHRYTRTEHCWNDFLNCFDDCDQLFIADIYPAGEKPIEGITSARLAKEIKHPNCSFLVRDSSTIQVLEKVTHEKSSVLITLGAGDILKVGIDFLES